MLFFVLLSRGIFASKTRSVPLAKLAIIPVGLTLWSLWDLLQFGGITVGLVVVFVVALSVGGLAGWNLMCRKKIEVVDRANKILNIPRSWTTLIIIMIVFVAKYTFGFAMATDPQFMHQVAPLYTMFVVSAITSGILCGRLTNYIYRFQIAK